MTSWAARSASRANSAASARAGSRLNSQPASREASAASRGQLAPAPGPRPSRQACGRSSGSSRNQRRERDQPVRGFDDGGGGELNGHDVSWAARPRPGPPRRRSPSWVRRLRPRPGARGARPIPRGAPGPRRSRPAPGGRPGRSRRRHRVVVGLDRVEIEPEAQRGCSRRCRRPAAWRRACSCTCGYRRTSRRRAVISALRPPFLLTERPHLRGGLVERGGQRDDLACSLSRSSPISLRRASPATRMASASEISRKLFWM